LRDLRGELGKRRYHSDFDRENSGAHRTSDALSDRICEIAETGSPNGTDHPDGQASLFESGTDHRLGQPVGKSRPDLLDDQRSVQRPRF
jgi:hypothetical protein